MKKRVKKPKRMRLVVPTLRILRESIERGETGLFLIKEGEKTGAGSVYIRYVLKHRPWIITFEAKRRYDNKH